MGVTGQHEVGFDIALSIIGSVTERDMKRPLAWDLQVTRKGVDQSEPGDRDLARVDRASPVEERGVEPSEKSLPISLIVVPGDDERPVSRSEFDFAQPLIEFLKQGARGFNLQIVASHQYHVRLEQHDAAHRLPLVGAQSIGLQIGNEHDSPGARHFVGLQRLCLDREPEGFDEERVDRDGAPGKCCEPACDGGYASFADEQRRNEQHEGRVKKPPEGNEAKQQEPFERHQNGQHAGRKSDIDDGQQHPTGPAKSRDRDHRNRIDANHKKIKDDRFDEPIHRFLKKLRGRLCRNGRALPNWRLTRSDRVGFAGFVGYSETSETVLRGSLAIV